jgi:hypothetical protein
LKGNLFLSGHRFHGAGEHFHAEWPSGGQIDRASTTTRPSFRSQLSSTPASVPIVASELRKSIRLLVKPTASYSEPMQGHCDASFGQKGEAMRRVIDARSPPIATAICDDQGRRCSRPSAGKRLEMRLDKRSLTGKFCFETLRFLSQHFSHCLRCCFYDYVRLLACETKRRREA